MPSRIVKGRILPVKVAKLIAEYNKKTVIDKNGYPVFMVRCPKGHKINWATEKMVNEYGQYVFVWCEKCKTGHTYITEVTPVN
jgi:hypothetical protein